MEVTRLFFALDIETKDADIIEQWRNTHINNHAFINNFTAVPKANYHITLAFIGNVNNTLKIALVNEASIIANTLNHTSSTYKQAKQTKYPVLILDQLGLFKKPKVLYITTATIPTWLSKLAFDLVNSASQLGLIMENRPYLPHVTLYRKAKSLPSFNGSCNINIDIKSFSLYQSKSSTKGVIYSAINTWKI